MFTYLFYQHVMFRRSCEKCHFCNTQRPSDITIADFWGWEKTDPNINKDDKGVSLILVNTDKGRALFEAIKNDLNYTPAKIENCMQPNLQRPSTIHPRRVDFERDFERRGFKYLITHYTNIGWESKVIRGIRKIKRILIFCLKNSNHVSTKK